MCSKTYAVSTGILLAVLGFLTMTLSGCNGRGKPLEDYINEVKSRPARPIEPLPEFKSIPTHSYSAAQERSPFKKKVMQSDLSYQPDLDRPKELLESFTLDSLKMVGELRRNQIAWGLVATPEGKVFPVKEGNYMGQNYGKIVKITRDEIVLEETVQGANGWEKRPASLVLVK